MPPSDRDGLNDASGGEDDGEVGRAVESEPDFVVGDGDVDWHVDEVAEDLARLRFIVSAHTSGEQTVEPGGDDEQHHVEVRACKTAGGRFAVRQVGGFVVGDAPMTKLIWRLKLVAEMDSEVTIEAEVARIEQEDFAVPETLGCTPREINAMTAANQAEIVRPQVAVIGGTVPLVQALRGEIPE